jgi:protocatechuate 3,4-dioxygenase beta subunit
VPHTTDLLPLRGRVVDTNQLPVAGARIELRRRPTLTFSMLDTELSEASETLAGSDTDRDGRFELALVRAQPCELAVTAAGFEHRCVHECYGGQSLVIVLARGAIVQGRIISKAGGKPIRGAQVSVGRANLRPSGGIRNSSETGPEGTYRFEDLEAGEHILLVRPPEGEIPRFRLVRLASGETSTQDYEIALGEITKGRVTDASTGAPLAGAEVGID